MRPLFRSCVPTLLCNSVILMAAGVLLSCGDDTPPPEAPIEDAVVDTAIQDADADADHTVDASIDAVDLTEEEAGDVLASIGSPCDEDEDCDTGLCIQIELRESRGLCSRQCETNADCPEEDMTCREDPLPGPRDRSYCLPSRLCIDEDDDEYGIGPQCIDRDCDDTNADINPGAEERCDGLDDDCNDDTDDVAIYDLESEIGDAVYSGTTAHWGDSFVDTKCDGVGEGADDRAFSWTAPDTGSYNFEVENADFSPMLYARDTACLPDGEQDIFCTAYGGSITHPFAEDQTVIIIVDGTAPGQSGEFDLNITFVPDHVDSEVGLCSDGIDNDGDGPADCADTADCGTFHGCIAEVCDNSGDDDGDGAFDCDDTECSADLACPEDCANETDDDADGLVDCDDDECSVFHACIDEICDNSTDDDHDTDLDCFDSECVGTLVCTEICDNGLDDDVDGLFDCFDTDDCSGDLACTEICDNRLDDDGDDLVDCYDIDCAGHEVCPDLELACDNEFDDDSDTYFDCDDPDCGGAEACEGIAHDPRADADDRLPGDSFLDEVDHLFVGEDPIQTIDDPNVIVDYRVAVLSGHVSDSAEEPLAGVTISVNGQPELGFTTTRSDGQFDMVVNGGGLMTVTYEKDGYLSVQRRIDVPWEDYAELPDVVMIEPSSEATVVDLSLPDPVVVQGDVETDDDGTRQANLFVLPGTTAQLTFATGDPIEIDALTLRITEYTVSEAGPERMPAELPATTAYTYAFEISADEATAAGANHIVLNQAIPFYVDNFLGFPNGGIAPFGWYDYELGQWVAGDDGRVISIVGETDGLANLNIDDVEGAESAAELYDQLEISEAERRQLAETYDDHPTSLWRVPITHMTPGDINWPRGAPSDAEPPPGGDPGGLGGSGGPGGSGSGTPGSGTGNDAGTPGTQWDHDPPVAVIRTYFFSQVLAVSIPITGTPFNLHYQSDRARGRTAAYSVDVPLTDSTTPPTSLVAIEATLSVAGGGPPMHRENCSPCAPNITRTLIWDGMDGLGLPVDGIREGMVTLDYVYQPVFLTPGSGGQSFGDVGGDEIDVLPRSSSEFALRRTFFTPLGVGNTSSIGLNGWTLSDHHRFDPDYGLLLGTGERITYNAPDHPTIITVAGDLDFDTSIPDSGNGGPAEMAQLTTPRQIAIAADGTMYIADFDDWVIRRVDPDGIISVYAGGGDPVDRIGDNGPATGALLAQPIGVALDNQGNLYISESYTNRVRRVDAITQQITTIIGLSTSWCSLVEPCGDGGPASLAGVVQPANIEVGPDGSIYIVDQYRNRIRRIDPGTNTISTVAGNGYNYHTGDGGQATLAGVGTPKDIAVSADGRTLYIAQGKYCHVRQVDLGTGIITSFTGSSFYNACGNTDDGVQAANAHLRGANALAIGDDGSVFVYTGFEVVRIDPQGLVHLIAGNGNHCTTADCGGEGVLATDASISGGGSMELSPNGGLYLAVSNQGRVVRLNVDGVNCQADQFTVPSPDGSEVYVFDVNGSHLVTRTALTGEEILSFGYDPAGRLLSVVDAFGNETTIQRDGNGLPNGITAPGSQETLLGVNIDGHLATITNPASETYEFDYDSGGLLTELTDPRNSTHTFEYDSAGRLSRNNIAGPQNITLTRTDNPNGYEVLVNDSGITTTYEAEFLESGESRFTTTHNQLSASTVVVVNVDGSQHFTYQDGTEVTTATGPHPIWGLLAPITTEQMTTTPAGRSTTTTTQMTAELSDPNDPHSIVSLTQTVELDGRVYTQTYDPTGLTVTRLSPELRETTTTLNVYGMIEVVSLGAGLDDIVYQYDSFGRLDLFYQGVQTWDYVYDEDTTRVVSVTDSEGTTLAYGHDDADRVDEFTLESSRSYTFSRDENGNITAITRVGGNTHSLDYNETNFLESYTPPDAAGSLVRDYDAHGAIDLVTMPSAAEVDYVYDPAGRLTTISYDEAEVTFSYDGASQDFATITWTPTTGSAQTITYTYDGPLLTAATYGGVATGTYTYYDVEDTGMIPDGMSFVSGSDAVELDLDWDDDGLLTIYGDFNFTRVGSVDIDGVGDVGLTTQIDDGTGFFKRTYDGLGHTTGWSVAVNGSTIYELSLTFDNAGGIEQAVEVVDETSRTYGYTYDVDDRLLEVSLDDTTIETYTYDDDDNRNSRQFGAGPIEIASHNSQDQIANIGDFDYTFNTNGFLATREGDTYTYSPRGELLRVDLGTGGTITYTYDGLGRRVARTEDGQTTQYFYGSHVSAFDITYVRDGDGELTTLYYDDNGLLFALERAGARYYVATNQVGSTRLVIDATGTIIKNVEYDAFGNPTELIGAEFFLPIGFAGGLVDPTTGLVRFGFRDYDPMAGSWMLRDPALFGGCQTNLYVYVANDPISLRDPTGLATCIGGDYYRIFGAGGEVCWDDQGWSACIEGGVGIGSRVYQREGGLANDGMTIAGVLDLSYNSDFGARAGRGWHLDGSGIEVTQKVLRVDIGPIQITPDGLGARHGFHPGNIVRQDGRDWGINGKIYGRICHRSGG